jgi:hypothetical protein
VCPTAIHNSGQCISDTSWTASIDQQTLLTVYQQNATTAYSRQNLSILHFDTDSTTNTSYIETSLYWTIWDVLFDQDKSQQALDSMWQNSIFFQLNWFLRLYQDRFQYDQRPLTYLQNFIAIPLQFSTTALQFANATFAGENLANVFPLPADLDVTASGARVITRFKGQVWTFCVFTAIGSSLVLYPGLILAWILLQKVALLFSPSGFPVVDFALLSSRPERDLDRDGDRQELESERERRTIAQLAQAELPGNPPTCRIAGKVRGKTLHVETNPGNSLTLTESTAVITEGPDPREVDRSPTVNEGVEQKGVGASQSLV